MFRTIKQRRRFFVAQRDMRYEVAAIVEDALSRDKRFYCPYNDKYKSQLRSVQFKHICILSGKARGILRYGFSRHSIKIIGTRGLLLGFRKASW